MASPTRFPPGRRGLRAARALPLCKPEPFAALPSVKKKPEPNRPILGRISSDDKRHQVEDDDEDDDEDGGGNRPTLGTMDALAFQQSILGNRM